MPAPPSLVALPPIPIIKCVRPSSSAARISSPTPYVVAMRGSRCSAGTSGRPELAAISITALRPSPISPKKASTGCPKGPVTSRSTTCPLVASTSACVVPSPPSATGTILIAASGYTSRAPSAIAWPVSAALRLPFNDCGATTILIALPAFPGNYLCPVGCIIADHQGEKSCLAVCILLKRGLYYEAKTNRTMHARRLLFMTSYGLNLTWHWSPFSLAALVLLCLGYGLTLWLMHWCKPQERPIKKRQIAWFCGGVLIIVLFLFTPLDAISRTQLFLAPMFQVVFIITLAVPALLFPSPALLFPPPFASP